MTRDHSHRRTTQGICLNQFREFPSDEFVLVIIVSTVPAQPDETSYFLEATLFPFNQAIATHASPSPSFKSQPLYFSLPSEDCLSQCQCTISITLRGKVISITHKSKFFQTESILYFLSQFRQGSSVV